MQNMKKNWESVVSLVLGIFSIAGVVFGVNLAIFLNFSIWQTKWLYIIVLIVSIVGLILGIDATKKTRSSIGISGIVLSVIALGMSCLCIMACEACIYMGCH